MRQVTMLAALCVLAGLACTPPPREGTDGDVDVDVDADADADGDGGGETCPPEADCCEDSECSNGIFCDGVEVCDRGRCEPGLPRTCDDGLACTRDECDEARNLCVSAPLHEECDDGDRCTGEERCNPTGSGVDERGCVAGSPLRCDDGDACTDDYCEAGECRTRIRDADGDGHGDYDCAICDPEDPRSCERGDDCNDADPTVYPGAVEICDDGQDNNCDRVRDYADPACAVPNDTCAAAITLADGVTVHSSTRGTTADIATACGAPTDRDVAFFFNVPVVQDLELEVGSRSGEVTVSLTSACGDPAAEVRCLSGRTFTLFARALPAGTYYAVVSAAAELDFSVTLHLDDPATALPGDLCVDAIDVGAGGSFTGETTGMLPDYESRCGDVTDLDAAYTFTLTEARSVDLSVTAGAGPVAVAIQPDCGVVATERTCFRTTGTTERHFRSLDPGRYYLIFKTPAADAFGFELTFGPPEPTLLDPWIDPAGATTVALSAGSSDDGQYNIDIAPLTFPFNGTSYGCVAVSTNGYVRFGAAGACPSATAYSDTATDIDDVYAAGTAQVTWLGDDGYAGSSVTSRIDTAGNRVVITYLDHHRLSYSGQNDVQVILHCDTGDIQISYGDCTFDTGTSTTYHWSIGLSEPALAGGTLQPHDFPGHPSGTVVSFGPGAINQSPEHAGPAPYLPLNGRAIYFARDGSGWSVLVDAIPL